MLHEVFNYHKYLFRITSELYKIVQNQLLKISYRISELK